MAASTLLATREELKRYLGIDAGETGPDALLDQLLEYASERIESHCGRRFASEELTEYHDGPGTSRLVLDRRPVTDLSAAYVDADRDFGASTVIPAEELVLYPEAGLLVRAGSPFPRGARNVKVVYTAGYTSLPDDLAAACVKLAAAWYAHSQAGADGIRRETLGEYRAEYAGAPLPADVESALAPYREPAAG